MIRKAAPILLVFALAALLLLARLGALPLDEAEARSAIVARQVLTTGHWLWPSLPRPFACEKSPLVYWQAVPFAGIEVLMSGGALGVSELAVRLPSVLWALALLFFTWDIARHWHDDLTALLSAGVLATSYGFVHSGRHGTPEMAQAATILWCLWHFVKHRSGAKRCWLYAFGLLVGIAANFGAREAYGVVILGVLVLSMIAKDWAWLRPARTVVVSAVLSVVVFLTFALAASLAAGSAEPLRALWREHVARYLRPPGQAFGWHKDLWRLVMFCLPWLVLVPIAKVREFWLWRRGGGRPSAALLVGGAALVWLALSSSSEPRHVVTVVPFAAIVAGRLLAQFSRGELGRLASGAVRAVLALAGVGAMLLPIYVGVPASRWAVLVPVWLAGATLIAGGLTRKGVAALAAVAVLWLVHFATPSLHWAPGGDVRDQVAKVRALRKPVAFIGHVPAQVAFYLNWPFSFLSGTADIQRWATERPGGVVIAARKPEDPSWETLVQGVGWQALTWNPQARAVALTRDPAWLAKHPLRGIKSETLSYVFSAEAGLRLNLGTVTMRLFREEAKDGRRVVIAAESKGGVPGYPMASVITSRLRESDLGQIEADDLRTKPSFKHRRFTWRSDGVDYHRRKKDEPGAWRLKEAFRQPGASDAYHVIAACYIARGFDLRPAAPPQLIRVINNQQMWDVAVRAAEEKTIEVPAGRFPCVRVDLKATPLNKEAKESADEAEGPFGLTGYASLYVDKATKALVLLEGQIELGAAFKVQVMLTKREAEAQ